MFTRLTLKKELALKNLQQLSCFLEAQYEDAKPLNLTQAHGFLCAIASSPCLIMPSKYQPVLFGGYPEFDSMKQAETIIGLVDSLYSVINSDLNKEKVFIPLLWQNNNVVTYDESPLELVGDWCKGYLTAVKLDPVWSSNKEGEEYLVPFRLFGDKQFSLIGELDEDGKAITNDLEHKLSCKKMLPKYVNTFYHRWSSCREDPTVIYGNQMPPEVELEKIDPTTRSSFKIGRNEPCPCGSNLKFKKCCGIASQTIH